MPIFHLSRSAAARASAIVGALLVLALSGGCGVQNDPNPPGALASNTEFVGILQSTPKYLDPTASYAADEAPITYLIYEPPYRYHYLKRPYSLEGRAASALAEPYYLDAAGHRLPDRAPPEQVAQSVYEIHLRPGILYAPHPALARNARGELVYAHVTSDDLRGKSRIADFPLTGTREVVAEDYAYAIKRLATPRIKSPALSTFTRYIDGLDALKERLAHDDAELRRTLAPGARDLPFLDLRRYSLPGVDAPDAHTLRIRIRGRYPQFKYWLSMTFFAPVPWEADAFYAQPGMAAHDFSLNFWPVGSGPYMLADYQVNRRVVLIKNPNFRGERYPCEGGEDDRAAGLLALCGQRMPFNDRIEMVVEPERVPLANKFVDGFYDEPDLIHPEFGIRFSVEARDSVARAKELTARGLRFPLTTEPSVWYLAFNWLDPVVGRGHTPEEQQRHRKLRQALQIAVNWEEYTQIFETKGGIAAQGPIPPNVFGYRGGADGLDRVAYDWVDGRPVRKSLERARQLLAEAGYPGGRDAKTGQPLVLNYDYERIATPDYKPEIEWVIKQFAKLGIQLEVRATDYNRFQDKMDAGSAQVFWWGWYADYPDAENFMSQFYGPLSKALTHGDGTNASNYQNDEFDRLYARMRLLDDGAEKQTLLNRMVEILQDDSPWLWGYNPFAAGAYHDWMQGAKPSVVINDKLEYEQIDAQLRAREVARWNRPIVWPLGLILLAVLAALYPAWRGFRRRERASALPVPQPAATEI